MGTKVEGLIHKLRLLNGPRLGDLILINDGSCPLTQDELKVVCDEVRLLTGGAFEAVYSGRKDLLVWPAGEPAPSGEEEEERMVALGLRAVACPQWRWMAGMLAYYPVKPLQSYLRYTSRQVDQGQVWSRGIPDLRDAATLGCLLELIGWTRVTSPRWITQWQITGNLAEALVSELEAEAPRFLLEQKKPDLQRELEGQQVAAFVKAEREASLGDRSQDFLDGRHAALVEVSEMLQERVEYNRDNGLSDKHSESLIILTLVSNLIEKPSKAFTAGAKACARHVLSWFEGQYIRDQRRAEEPAEDDEDQQERQRCARESAQSLQRLRSWASSIRF